VLAAAPEPLIRFGSDWMRMCRELPPPKAARQAIVGSDSARNEACESLASRSLFHSWVDAGGGLASVIVGGWFSLPHSPVVQMPLVVRYIPPAALLTGWRPC
jgi:hypothetical protein